MLPRRDFVLVGATAVAEQAAASWGADAPATAGTPLQTLANSATECVRTGEACLQHCLTTMPALWQNDSGYGMSGSIPAHFRCAASSLS